jgi:hypothetical protein
MKKLSIILGLALLALFALPAQSHAEDTYTAIIGNAVYPATFVAPITTSTRVVGYRITCAGACQASLRSGISTTAIKLRPGLGAAGTEIVSLRETHRCGGKPGMCFPTGIYAGMVTASTSTTEIYWEKR